MRLRMVWADGIARMPRRAAIDGGGAIGRVLRHMGGNVEIPQVGDEGLCVVAFVGAQRQASRVLANAGQSS